MELNSLQDYVLGSIKFRHNFQDSLDPFWNDRRHIETTITSFFTSQITQIEEKLFFNKKQ